MMADDDSGSSWWDGIEHVAEGALDATGHAIEWAGEETASAFEAAGATAEEAAQMAASDLDVIPGVSEVVSVAQTAYHASAAIGDAVVGDWNGAADQSLSMAESAANAATFGVVGLAEGAYDMYNASEGGGESTDAHHEVSGALQTAGNWLGDQTYDLVNGDGS